MRATFTRLTYPHCLEHMYVSVCLLFGENMYLLNMSINSNVLYFIEDCVCTGCPIIRYWVLSMYWVLRCVYILGVHIVYCGYKYTTQC